MICHIARREVQEHVRSARFIALCGLTLLLLPLSAHVNASEFRSRLAQAGELRALQQRTMAEPVVESGAYESRYGWRDGEVIADPALRAIRAPSRFAVLAIGADASQPAYWQFSTEGVEPGPTAVTDGTGRSADRMDAVFIVQSVLGLLALLLVFDAVSGERDSGVLRLLLSTPVRRSDLLIGKAVGALLTLSVPLVLGVGAALAVLELQGVSLLGREGLVRVGIVLVASAMYLMNMVALGLAVSTSTRQPRSSWVALLLVWIGVVLIIPRAAGMFAATVRPVRPAFETRQAKTAAILQVQRERARTLADAWRRSTGTDSVPEGHVDDALRAAYARASAEDERRLAARKRSIIRDAETARARSVDRRERLGHMVGRLSPAMSYAAIAAEMAGTGTEAAGRWSEQVAAHQLRLESATFDRSFGLELYPPQLNFLRIIWWPELGSDARSRPPDYGELPQFAFREPPIGALLRRSAPDLAVLIVGSVVWLAFAIHAFQRAEVQ
jgi:ABC-type transport system involved in multi-copper enzyme maturation permease subunit